MFSYKDYFVVKHTILKLRGHESVEKLTKQQKKNKPKKGRRVIDVRIIMIITVFILYSGATIWSSLRDTEPLYGKLEYNQLMTMLDNGEIESVRFVKGNPLLTIHTKNGEKYDMINPDSDTFLEDIMKKGANIVYSKAKLSENLISIGMSLPMIAIMLVLITYLVTVVMSSQTKTFSVIKDSDNHTSFNDIRGLTETKGEVEFLVNHIKDWKNLGELGARPIKGILFYGPPGTGKTLMAKAIAKESGVKFISASGSDFIEQFVGMGARRVRDLWQLAETNSPCVLFIDEIDCLGKRSTDGDIVSREHNQTMNALLQRMDGLSTKAGILVVAATNSIESLDDALLRSGRFDRKFYVGPPKTKADRDSVVELYLENKKLAENITTEAVSKLLVGFSAADIDEILSEAVYISLMAGRNGILQLSDIDDASMKLRVGGVVKEHTTEHDMEITAVHEAAHALIHLLQGDKVSKVSIVAYSSGVGGVTIRDMDDIGDIQLLMKSDMEKQIRALLAGKCGEDVVYGEHTQGCSNDIEKASDIVYEMVTSFAYNSSMMMNMKGKNRLFDERVIAECNEVLEGLERETTKMLTDNREKLDALRDRLLKEKTLVNPTL